LTGQRFFETVSAVTIETSHAESAPRLNLPFSISFRAPLLVATFDAPQAMLSWSLTKPGFQDAQRVAWLEVRNVDLPASEDPLVSIARLMRDHHIEDAVTLITSRNVARHHLFQATVEGETATCLATVGLSNGERVGERCAEPVWLPGTVNTLVHVSSPLTQGALVETVSIVAQARTAAILDTDVRRAGAAITGTGTDCIVVAAPKGADGARFAGLHTAIGEAVGKAVYRAVAEGAETWRRDFTALVGDSAAARLADGAGRPDA
jgi:adenosylcobinamide amidohydrolase